MFVLALKENGPSYSVVDIAYWLSGILRNTF